MPEAESYRVVAPNDSGTGVGTDAVVSSSSGIVMGTGYYVKYGSNLLNDRHFITVDLLAATVDNYAWSCNQGTWKVDYVTADQTVAGGSGATVDVKVCTPTTAPASGTTQLSAAIDLATAGNNGKSVKGVVIASPTDINPGDRLAVDMSGTLTALVGKLTIGIKRVR